MRADQGKAIVDLWRSGATTEELADAMLALRLGVERRGLPDLMARSNVLRNLHSDIYRQAGATERQRKNLRNRMANLLVEYLRGLDHSPKEAGEHFGLALVEHPEMSPTDAVYAAYEARGITLPKATRSERVMSTVSQGRRLVRGEDPGEVLDWIGDSLDKIAAGDPDPELHERAVRVQASAQALVRRLES